MLLCYLILQVCGYDCCLNLAAGIFFRIHSLHIFFFVASCLFLAVHFNWVLFLLVQHLHLLILCKHFLGCIFRASMLLFIVQDCFFESSHGLDIFCRHGNGGRGKLYQSNIYWSLNLCTICNHNISQYSHNLQAHRIAYSSLLQTQKHLLLSVIIFTFQVHPWTWVVQLCKRKTLVKWS